MDDHTDSKSDGELRRFGLTTGAMIALLFGLVLPWLRHSPRTAWESAWAVAALLGGLALLHPRWLSGVYRVWMYFSAVLGWINTRILLSVVFYLILTPAGALARLLGRDSMQRRFDRVAQSYRQPSTVSPPDRMKRPF
ncbi:MAG: hypothetical protein B7Z66_13890 [Chromatiales bacterium 21-64-14]|nr:MAG: hypothetical protein B7Z66_13890 [Chromatiales bacterium 21-64-14]HQU15018.1 SxtJ family membrane protein [Gammaproteobacteria bacterium]